MDVMLRRSCRCQSATALRVDLWIEEERLTPSAVVRTRDPGVGMGIEFTGLTDELKKRFQAHLDKLDPAKYFRSQRRPITPLWL